MKREGVLEKLGTTGSVCVPKLGFEILNFRREAKKKQQKKTGGAAEAAPNFEELDIQSVGWTLRRCLALLVECGNAGLFSVPLQTRDLFYSERSATMLFEYFDGGSLWTRVSIDFLDLDDAGR